jgi:hypothetical protein
MGKHFYEDEASQCTQKSIVGELGRAKVCVCEFVAGHGGTHERIPTMRLAGVREFELPHYKKFVSK